MKCQLSVHPEKYPIGLKNSQCEVTMGEIDSLVEIL